MIGTALGIALGAAAGAGGNIAGAAINSSAAGNAADIQAQSQREALDFEKQYAEGDWKNQEATRRANYEQWAAEQARKGSIGQMFGLPGVSIPEYVPSTDPNYTGAGLAVRRPAGIGSY